jgi:predicted nuclease with TOPRIM domain
MSELLEEIKSLRCENASLNVKLEKIEDELAAAEEKYTLFEKQVANSRMRNSLLEDILLRILGSSKNPITAPILKEIGDALSHRTSYPFKGVRRD